jgi:KaiC/GvpD/RAD55 family RecA-like ATPase
LTCLLGLARYPKQRFVTLLLVGMSALALFSCYTQVANGQSATTLTTIIATTNTYFSGPFAIPGIKPGSRCSWTQLEFIAYKGQHVSGLVTSKTPISFYLMPDSVENDWFNAGPCDGAPAGSLIARDRITTYQISFDFSSGGRYSYFLLNFVSAAKVVTANFDLTSSIIVTSTVLTQSTPMTILSQSTSMAVLNQSTASTVPPSTGTTNIGLMPFGNLGLIGIGATVAVIVSVLVFARKRKPSLAATLKQERPARVQESPRDAVASQPITKPSVAAVLKQERPSGVQEPGRDIVSSQPIISTGYVDLDQALQGGIPERFSVVIVSPSYDERDLLLRKVIESTLSAGRLAILVSNDISRTEDLTSRYTKGFYAFSSQADKILSHGPNLVKVPSIENLSEANLSLSLAIKDAIAKETGSKPIIIVDILSDVLLRHKSITTRRWLSDFVGKRKAEGFTIIATLNPLTTTKEETQSIIDFFDGVIEIFEKPLMERARRFLIIRKMYGRRYSENEVLVDKDKLF